MNGSYSNDFPFKVFAGQATLGSGAFEGLEGPREVKSSLEESAESEETFLILGAPYLEQRPFSFRNVETMSWKFAAHACLGEDIDRYPRDRNSLLAGPSANHSLANLGECSRYIIGCQESLGESKAGFCEILVPL